MPEKQLLDLTQSVDSDGRAYAPLENCADCPVCGGQLDYIPGSDYYLDDRYRCQHCDRVFVAL